MRFRNVTAKFGKLLSALLRAGAALNEVLTEAVKGIRPIAAKFAFDNLSVAEVGPAETPQESAYEKNLDFGKEKPRQDWINSIALFWRRPGPRGIYFLVARRWAGGCAD